VPIRWGIISEQLGLLLAGEILGINGLKKPSGRDFTVGGLKSYDQSADKHKLPIEDLFENGMNSLNLVEGQTSKMIPM
jgi:hypothetical protein